MKQSKNKIAIISVNYNNPLATVSCILSFSGSRTRHNLRFYVVNNGCTDDSKTTIPSKLKNTNIIDSSINLGFSGGNNLGIDRAIKDGCTHILLINNDAKITSESFLDHLLASPYDITSSVILSANNDTHKNDYGGLVDWYFGRNTHRYNPGKIDYVSGACLFASSDVFKKVGKLDEKFFLYYEDADFCLRASKLGFTIGVDTKTSLRHQLSATANKLGYKKTMILANSHLLYCLKHLSLFALPLYIGFNLYLRLSAFFPKKHK